ncbi:hypothetical protein [Sphingomonas sp. 3-13AW]|uniref:hypothetical protein n=1 Tax=Sphingomonas sp. 3-13AW TaxID=3050450 RepID=UPI003BB5EDB1
MALRCAVTEDAPLLARNASTLSGGVTGGPAPAPVMMPLPRMMVDGWTVSGMPVAEALSQLGAEGGFRVEADSGLAPVSWNGEAASLTSVVTRLAHSAGGAPSFDGKVLRISKPVAPAPWRFQRPAGRDATLALLDALRGYGATEVALGAEDVTFHATPASVARIRKGLAPSTNVIAFDVWTYRLEKTSTVDWKALDEIAPVLQRKPTVDGERFVLGYVASEKVADFLARFGRVSHLGSQTVAGPQGWALEVPLTQCGQSSEKLGSITIKPTWERQTMALDLSGSPLGGGKIDAIAPGSSAIITSGAAAGATVVAVVRPRVLVAR